MTIRRKGNKRKIDRSKDTSAESTRERILKRLGALKKARMSWERAWKTIIEQILPYRARWNTSDYNDGSPLTSKIVNSTPTDVLRVLMSGMMSGVTSPAKQWFRLTVDDNEMKDDDEVKRWLESVEKILAAAFEKYGFYREISGGVYPDLGMIGVAAMLEEADEDGNPMFESIPVGEFYLDVNDKGKIDTFMRERVFTVKQVVDKFSIENCSTVVQQNWKNGVLDKTVDVVFCVWPNTDYDKERDGLRGRPWSSYWIESKGEEDKILEQGGYHEFPLLSPRWQSRSGEAYGRGPGWYAVSDCLALQHLEKKLAKMVDKTADPPMVGVDTIKTKRGSLLPGSMTYVPAGVANAFVPAQEIKPQSISVLENNIARHERRIQDHFYYRLWMSLINDPRNQRPTATEVEATRQEVMLQLGPVLENLNLELLDPLITRTFNILLRSGRIPPSPEKIDGIELKIQFISVMHMAQHMVGIAAVREVENHVFALAEAQMPEALLKIDAKKIVDEVAEMSGAPRSIIRTDEEVEKMEAEMAAQVQAERDGQAALAATEGARNLGGVDPNNVRAIAQSLGPVVSAQGGF